MICVSSVVFAGKYRAHQVVGGVCTCSVLREGLCVGTMRLFGRNEKGFD